MKGSPKVKLNTLDNEQLDNTPTKGGSNGNTSKGKKGKKSSDRAKKAGASIKKFFRDLASELKKVSWGKMKDTKNNKGVLSQTGIVLLFVLIAIVILTCMDLGLTALLNLLIGIAG